MKSISSGVSARYCLIFCLCLLTQVLQAQNQFPVPTGNVGINFLNPTEALCVGGNISLTGNIITTNGSLGIGTTTPQTRLHVEGGSLINGDLLLGVQKDDVGYGKRLEQMIGDGIVKKNMDQLFRIFPDSAVHVGDR